MDKNNKKIKKTKKTKKEKEAEILSVKKYTKDDMEFTETVKKIDKTTSVLTTPWGTKIKANDITKVLDEYYSLSPEDREREKPVWVSLISSMAGQREDGLKIVDIELALDGSKQVRFIYR
jgi:hypothetical protein